MNSTRGGFRENSGRKPLNKNKKIPKQIYFPPELAKQIEDTNLLNCSSFSAKAINLISLGLKAKEQNDIINEIRGLSNEDCQRVSAYIAGLKQGKQDQEYIIKKFRSEA